MHANCGEAYSGYNILASDFQRPSRRRTVSLGNVYSMLRFLETRARHHHFLASDIKSPLHDIMKVIFVCLLVTIDAAKDGIR